MAKITVVAPIYNVENYLTTFLDSILSQTLKDIQVILVNDGSTDSSEKIIDEYVQNYPNIFEKINKQNGGQASARNAGIERAIGEYIIFLDSDDHIEPDMLSKLYNEAVSNNYDLVFCDYYEINNGKKTVKQATSNMSDNNKINFMLSNPSPWNKLIKTSIIKENNIKFLENYIYEDLATIPILTCYINKIKYLQIPLYNYIIRAGSTMRQIKYNVKLESIFTAIEFLETQFKERNYYEIYKNELEYLNILHLLYASTGRFLQYPEGKPMHKKILSIVKNNYPTWKKNKYYNKQSIKFKIICNIFYSKNYILINLYNIIRKFIAK